MLSARSAFAARPIDGRNAAQYLEAFTAPGARAHVGASRL